VIAEHCEDRSLAENGQMHEGEHSYALGARRSARREAEEIVVARDLALARLTGGPACTCATSAAPGRSSSCGARRPTGSG
jgi:dihydroorotase-like cyclic amidohydrolase